MCFLQALLTPPAGKNGTGKFDGLFLGRRHISGSPVPIQGLTQETDGAVIQGTVVEYDLKDLRDNKKLCILKIADETNGMLCKRFFDKGMMRFLLKNILNRE